jgi:hypothetical protein
MGEASQQEKEAEHLCHRYVAQKVSGVFFAPLEYTPEKDAANKRIVYALNRAGISSRPARQVLCAIFHAVEV